MLFDVYIVLETALERHMQHYRHYKTVDFLTDDNFADWVRFPRPDSDRHWQEVFVLFPALVPFAEEARQMLLHMQIKPINGGTDDLQKNILDKAFDAGNVTTKKIGALQGKLYKWSAAALIVLVSGLILWKGLVTRSTKLEVVIAKDGGVKQVKNSADMALLVQLPDQSTVILQPKSQLSYQVDSFAVKRAVYLTGEAFFDITKNEQRPFVVNTDQLSTVVLGTSFFIHAEPGAVNHHVVVTSGSVRVKERIHRAKSRPDESDGLLLKAGEETRTKGDHSLVAIPSREALHMQDDFEKAFDFQNISMDRVAKIIQEYYGVPVRIESQVLTNRTITAFLGKVSLQEKLDLIAKAVEARYQLEDGMVIFTLKNQQ